MFTNVPETFPRNVVITLYNSKKFSCVDLLTVSHKWVGVGSKKTKFSEIRICCNNMCPYYEIQMTIQCVREKRYQNIFGNIFYKTRGNFDAICYIFQRLCISGLYASSDFMALYKCCYYYLLFLNGVGQFDEHSKWKETSSANFYDCLIAEWFPYNLLLKVITQRHFVAHLLKYKIQFYSQNGKFAFMSYLSGT